MSNLSKTLRCLNPLTGKRDGNYCTWEGQGKCLLCMAADEIDGLEKTLEQTEECYATLITTEIDATNRCKQLEAQLDRVQNLIDWAKKHGRTIYLAQLQAALNGEES